MTMTYQYPELPLDAEEAFLTLEDGYRRECEAAVSKSGEHDNVTVYYTDYIAQVLGAAEELGLVEAAFETEVPKIENVDFHTYQNFSKRVKHYRTRLEIRHARRIQGHSVSFDAATKAKVHHLLRQVHDIFTKLEVDEKKREALLAKLAALDAEVDRNRTRFESYAALAIEVADVAGEVIIRSKIPELLDSLARLFGAAKRDEEIRQLPAPSSPKRIEHQKPGAPTNASVNTNPPDVDDELPS